MGDIQRGNCALYTGREPMRKIANVLGSRTWIVVMLLFLAVYTWKLPLGLIPATYFLEPIAVSYDHETQELMLIRETRASRKYPWIRVYAMPDIEAQRLSSPSKTCPGPSTLIPFYEVIGSPDETQPPRDTTVFKAPWLAECLDGHDAIYRVNYTVLIEIDTAWLSGWRIELPRRVSFEARLDGRVASLENRMNAIEATLP